LSIEHKLNKVRNASTILSLLATSKESGSEVFIWRIIAGSKHIANVRIEALRKQRHDFSIVPTQDQDSQVADLMAGQDHIDLYIPKTALLLRCNIKTTDLPVRYYLQIPDFVVQVERRKSLRLQVYGTSEVRINFNKSVSFPRPMSQAFIKPCTDISTGGFSFYVSRVESKFFQIHDPIRNIELQAGNLRTKVSAEVALIKEVEPDEHNGLSYKAWRVCCRFSQIDEISLKYLERYIFERIKVEHHVINE
jgi:hypothetical protein